MKIKDREIGEGNSTYIIAEMSGNHAGSFNRAKEIIHAAKEAGADCIKIQTYTPDTLTIDCDNKYFHIDNGTWQGENLYHLYQKAYTPWDWQGALKEEADKVGIDFLSTPFDKTSVDFLEGIGIDFYKIASFELVDIPLIDYVASKGKPIILSTGMGSIEEISEAVDTINKYGTNKLCLLRCASAYPAISSSMNLKTMVDMMDKFHIPVGLSDHSLGVLGAVTAVAMGASVIEKHFCISREVENPDASFSMEANEFKQMVDDIRTVEKAKGCINYGPTKEEMSNIIFRKSIFAVKDIDKGETITESNIKVIRPGYGLLPKYYWDVLGKRTSCKIERGTPLQWDLLEFSDMAQCRLVKVDLSHTDILFQWANEKETRENAFHTEKIGYKTHQKWMQEKIADSNCLFYILREGTQSIGQIRLDIVENTGIISYSIDKNFRGKGYGKKILGMLENEINQSEVWSKRLKNLTAKVKYENKPSQKCFEKLDYKRIEKDQYVEYKKTVKLD